MNGRDPAVGVVAGLVVGFVVGAAVVAGLGTTVRTTSTSMTTETATGCVAPDTPTAGTVGVLSVADGVVATLNLTVVHESAAVNVTTDVEAASGGVYVVSVAASPDERVTEDEGTPPADCRPRTTVRAVASLPADAETVRVTYDGSEVASVSVESRSFAPLPPLNASSVGS